MMILDVLICTAMGNAFFLCFLLVIQLFCFFLISRIIKKSYIMVLSNFSDLLSLSSPSSSSVVDKTSKRFLQFILDISILLPCLRGPFVTVLNVSSDKVLQTDLFKYS